MSTKDLLRSKRKELKLTMKQVADYVGVSEATVSRWETGNIANMGRDKIALLSQILKLSPGAIAGYDESPIFSIPNIIPIPKTKNVPLLGTIACGEPILAEENIENYVTVDMKANVDFALKCKGDSMINARIFDGDIVYIHSQPDVENGEIAAVLIDNEATLKKVHKYPNKLVLSPCNPMYDDLVYTEEQLNDIRILGKAVIFVSTVR